MLSDKSEYDFYAGALKSAKKRLAYAQRAREGSAIHESVPSIEGHIEYLQEQLAKLSPPLAAEPPLVARPPLVAEPLSAVEPSPVARPPLVAEPPSET